MDFNNKFADEGAPMGTMKTVELTKDFYVPKIAAGCMRISSFTGKETINFINECLDMGVNFFDHADIYGKNISSESVFGTALKKDKALRNKMVLQTKCSIVPGKMFDFSYEHILSSVDKSLERLCADYIDILLLHRPDALMEPYEVAKAFDTLHKSGKVKYFGVSNHHHMQIELLKTALTQPLLINQLQFSAAFTGLIDSGLNVNMKNPQSVWHDGAILDYMRINDMTVQAWSPLQYGFFEGVFLDSDKFPQLNQTLKNLAEKYNTSPASIAYAFILRHPAKWQIITGTTKPQRIQDAVNACNFTLTREEWYSIYISAGNKLP